MPIYIARSSPSGAPLSGGIAEFKNRGLENLSRSSFHGAGVYCIPSDNVPSYGSYLSNFFAFAEATTTSAVAWSDQQHFGYKVELPKGHDPIPFPLPTIFVSFKKSKVTETQLSKVIAACTLRCIEGEGKDGIYTVDNFTLKKFSILKIAGCPLSFTQKDGISLTAAEAMVKVTHLITASAATHCHLSGTGKEAQESAHNPIDL
jgi:hypothetical protein